LEHLVAWRLGGADSSSVLTAFWFERTRRLFLRGNLDEARRTSARWLSVSALEGVKPEEEALANAFGVFVGTATHPELLTSEARFLPKVIAASRPVYLSSNPRGYVIDEASNRLRDIALDLVDFGYDIPLAGSIAFE
jgi:hypothetical protein